MSSDVLLLKRDSGPNPETARSIMVPFVYVASSSASGTTLLSFLLNTHPDVFTVSHTVGHYYPDEETFRCSCGAALPDCPFFSRLAQAMRSRGLPFKFNDFGTDYRAVDNERLNRWLTASLPIIHSSALERLRNGILWALPGVASKLRRQHLANRVFVDEALAFSGAKVFADTSQNPHRLRYLRRNPDFDISVIHLLRDPRGMAASYRRRHGYSAGVAAQNWLREQEIIVRVLREFDRKTTLHYEDLCEAPAREVERLYRFIGIEPHPLPENFKETEHHILGNVMRERPAEITKDERWRQELSAEEVETVQNVIRGFVRARPQHELSKLIERYTA
jgi:hypothetical protein